MGTGMECAVLAIHSDRVFALLLKLSGLTANSLIHGHDPSIEIVELRYILSMMSLSVVRDTFSGNADAPRARPAPGTRKNSFTDHRISCLAQERSGSARQLSLRRLGPHGNCQHSVSQCR